MSAKWHELLAGIPKDVRINRRAFVATELAKAGDAASVADWEALTIELSDGNEGLRHLTITVDAKGRPLSANDIVLFRRGLEDGRVEVRTESIGGRVEVDGRFFGKRWTSIGHETLSPEADTGIQSVATTPNDLEIDKLLALVRDLIKRRPTKLTRTQRERRRAPRDGAD